MADNVTLNAGTGGATIAADDIAGVHHQKVKVEFGADGTATEVQTSAPLPVRLGDGTDQANVTAAGELNVLATAQPGVDIGDVTVNNASGASAVNIQDGGNSITVDGNVSVTDGGASLTVDAPAGTPVAVRQSDGSTFQTFAELDLDSGAGTVNRVAMGLALPGAGGPVAGGTSANPVRTDPTGTTTQPVSAASLPLPSGAAQEHTTAASPHAARLSDGASFYDAAKTGQLPAALVGGRLDVVVGAALPAGTNNIGDVDVITLPNVTLAAGTNTNEVVGDAAHDAPVAGNPLLVGGRASDAVPTAVSADGDVVNAWRDRRGAAKNVVVDDAGDSCMDGANNALRVNIVAGAGSGGTAQADESAFTEGTTSFTPIGGVLNDTITSDPTEDQAAAARITPKRALHVNLRDASGNEVSPGGGTQYTVNAVVPADPVGTALVAERDDQLSALTEIEGDWTNARATAKGALWVAIPDANGDPITSFGGGTQYVEDDPAAANPTGTALTLVRNDARSGSLTTTDGDNVAARGTNSGELYVKHVDAIPVTDNAGSLTVDTPQLPASLVSGRLDVVVGAALPTGDNNIGNVDVLSTVNPTNGTASGALGALNAAVTISGQGAGTIHWEIDTGTLVGTVVFEATLDDTNWFAINAIRIAGAIIASTTSFADRGALDCAGYSQVRLRVSAYTSGTSNARLEASAGAGVVRLSQALPAGTNNIGDVDVLTVPAPLSTTGGGTEATALRVTLANDSTGLVSVDDNGGSLTIDNAALSITGGGTEASALRVTIANDSTGVVSVDDNGGSLTVDGTVTANAGTGTFATQETASLVDNAAFTDGTSRVLPAGFIFDETAGTVLTENDVAAARVNANRTLVGCIEDGATRARYCTVTASNALKVDGSAVTQPVSGTVTANAGTGSFTVAQATAANLKGQVQGEAAHDAAVAGNPVAIGGRANQNEPGTAVADGDATWLWTDKWGRLVTTREHPPLAAGAGTHGPYTENSTASGDVELIAAPGASTSIVVTGFWISNQGTAKNRVSLREGAAGTQRYRGTLAADGGGVVMTGLNWVLPANTALDINIGTAGDIDVSVDFYVQATP